MSTWRPLMIAALVTVMINGYPFFMAFVVGSEGWQQGGWALLFLTIPLGLVLLLAGTVMSIRRRLRSGRTGTS